MTGSAEELVVHEHDDQVCFDVRVTPRASKNGLAGVHAGALKLSLCTAPVDGAANEALIALLAKTFAIPKRAVTIVRGEHARQKHVCLAGVLAAEVRAAVASKAPKQKHA